jgi:hypothetical protein
MNAPAQSATKPKPHCFYPTPGRLFVILLAVELFLLLSDYFLWFGFNEKKGWTVLIAIICVITIIILTILWYVFAFLLRWRFQFSIRSLLILTLAVAIPCSWLAVKMKQAREQKEAVAVLKQSISLILYDYVVDRSGKYINTPAPSSPQWLRNIFGDDFFAEVSVIGFRGKNEADLANIANMSHLHSLSLNYSPISDAFLEHVLSRLQQLRLLELKYTKITDSGLRHLQGLKQLQTLDLSNTNISDAGLRHLTNLKQIEDLNLNDTQITDKGLKYLAELPDLRFLHLEGIQLSDSGLDDIGKIEQLQQIWLSISEARAGKLRMSMPNLIIDVPTAVLD